MFLLSACGPAPTPAQQIDLRAHLAQWVARGVDAINPRDGIENELSPLRLHVVDALGQKLDEVLATNLITPEAFKAALYDDYDAFLNERSKAITAAISKLTGW